MKKIVEVIAGMIRTYTFVFNPEPEGGFTVTCPALPGLVSFGETLTEARAMARDAMAGLIDVMMEKGTAVPDSDAPQSLPRFSRLAQSLHAEADPEPVLEQLTAQIAEHV